MKQLNVEELENLKDLVTQPGLRALVKVLKAEAERMEHEIITMSLTTGQEQEVLYAKARAEGSRRSVNRLISYLESLKNKQPD